MIKLEFLLILTILLFNASSSFANNSLFDGDALFNFPKVIGNCEFPKGVVLPQNITPPEGNVFKFYTIVSGFGERRCVNKTWVYYESRALHFNNEKDICSYPSSVVASTFPNPNALPGVVSLGIRSVLPSDTSTLITTPIVSIPKPGRPEDIALGLERVSNNTGKGAFADITYIARPRTRGGNFLAGRNITCGNDEYPEGYVYSDPFI
ncbi:17467_t:CDS:2, partial [Cetraspora pellucida]